MTQITINIPEDQVQFFVELTKKLGFEIDSKSADVNEWQKNTVQKRKSKLKVNPELNVDFFDLTSRVEKKFNL
ncbi:MAG: hypothetical protein ACK479_07740 [Fluviicola sp.]|jgi:hypothetical protein